MHAAGSHACRMSGRAMPGIKKQSAHLLGKRSFSQLPTALSCKKTPTGKKESSRDGARTHDQ